MDELIHLLAERIVLVSQALRKMLLIYDFLRCLIAMESQSAARTFHDDRRTQATEY